MMNLPSVTPDVEAEGELDAASSRRRRRNWLGWTIAAIILVACFFLVDLEEIGNALGRLTPASVALLLLLHTVDRLLMGYKWGLLLRILKVPMSGWQAVRIFYQSNFSGVFLPSHVGGDVLRVLWVREATGATHAAAASLVMERMLGMLSAVNWALIGGGVYLAIYRPEWAWLIAGGSILGLVAVNLLFAATLSRLVHDFVLRLLGRGGSKVARVLHKFYETYAEFSRDRAALARNALLTFVEHVLRIVLIWVTALAIGLELPLLAFLAATSVYMVILRFPIAPDGWGVGELTAIGIYATLGVSASDAFTLSVLGHLFPMLALLPGFFFLLRGQRRAPARS